MRRHAERADPYAILDDSSRRKPLRSLVAAFVVLVAFLAALYYVSTQIGEDDVPTAPGVNVPDQQ